MSMTSLRARVTVVEGIQTTDHANLSELVNVLSIDETNDRLGVNKTTPTTNLDVQGGAAVSGDMYIGGSLTVDGPTTTISSVTLEVEDKNIEMANGNTTDAGANGAGLTIKAGTDITFQYDSIANRMDCSRGISVNGTDVAVDGHSHGDLYFTETESDARFASLSHSHNDLYYTESEIDALFTSHEPQIDEVRGQTVHTSAVDLNDYKTTSGFWVFSVAPASVSNDPAEIDTGWEFTLFVMYYNANRVQQTYFDCYVKRLFYRSYGPVGWTTWEQVCNVSALATLLPLAGGTMSGAIAMGAQKITGMGNGSADTDACTYGQAIAIGSTLLPKTGGAMTGAITGITELSWAASTTATHLTLYPGYHNIRVTSGTSLYECMGLNSTVHLFTNGAAPTNSFKMAFTENVSYRPLAMSSQKITGLANGTSISDACNYEQLTTLGSGYLPLSGGTLSGSLSLGTNSLSSVVNVGFTGSVNSLSCSTEMSFIAGAERLRLNSSGVDVRGHKILNLANGTGTQDGCAYGQLTSGLSGKSDTSHTHSYLPLSGGTMTGAFSMNGYRITAVGTQVVSSDACRKDYADAIASASMSYSVSTSVTNLDSYTTTGVYNMRSNPATISNDPGNIGWEFYLIVHAYNTTYVHQMYINQYDGKRWERYKGVTGSTSWRAWTEILTADGNAAMTATLNMGDNMITEASDVCSNSGSQAMSHWYGDTSGTGYELPTWFNFAGSNVKCVRKSGTGSGTQTILSSGCANIVAIGGEGIWSSGNHHCIPWPVASEIIFVYTSSGRLYLYLTAGYGSWNFWCHYIPT